jgi:hypothetical protein
MIYLPRASAIRPDSLWAPVYKLMSSNVIYSIATRSEQCYLRVRESLDMLQGFTHDVICSKFSLEFSGIRLQRFWM